MRFSKKYGYAIYLGVASAVVGIDITSWEYYILNIPTILLVLWRGRK